MTGSPHLVITGPMGVGKSTTAAAMAGVLGRPLSDSDTEIEARFGRSGRVIAADEGVDELHRIEAAVLLDALAADEPRVIAAAAWVSEEPRCRAALAERAFVVVLEATIDVLVERSATGRHRRAVTHDDVVASAERRAPLFAEVADLVLDSTGPTAVIVDQILAAWTAR